MHSLFLALSTTAPSPTGTLRPGLTEDQISPGLWGFLATAFVVLLSIFLIVDMVRRLRRVRYRTQVEEDREREAEERRAEDDDAPDAGESEVTDGPAPESHEGSATNGTGNGSAP